MIPNNIKIIPIIIPVKSPLKSVNFYLIKTDHSLLLIDAGMNIDDCWQGLNTTLAKHDFTLQDITHIIITHHHVDHVGLINRIVENYQIPVYSHRFSVPRLRRDPEYLQKRIEFFADLYDKMGCGEAGEKQINYLKNAAKKNTDQSITYELHHIEELSLNEFQIVETPGHAIDQIALYDETGKTLLSGDLLIEHISSNALVEPDEFGNRMKTLVDHEASLKKIQALNIERVYPGHGQVIETPHDLIERRILGIENKANKFLALLEEKSLTASELAQQFYKDTYKKQFSLVMSEIIGHLDYLEHKGKVKKDFENGVWNYFV
ncbi:MBL fold metallo-hydrolase [Pueribacillus sp. YX66]|uniref:MBL fold metallo-hydrolase n=1 Tax=Pueribacillus sp. YX66 TaxID=3229242 RepID=UPI00358D2277